MFTAPHAHELTRRPVLIPDFVPVTEDGVPAGPVRFFAQTPDSFLDGLRIDACGRLYVPVYTTGRLYVFQPAGASPSLVVDYEPGEYGRGLSWGSGIGEWDDHNLTD